MHSTYRRVIAAAAGFTLAAGLAIATAPVAAAAGPITADGWRAQPPADAMWIDAAGAIRPAPSATIHTYANPGSSTGVLPTIPVGSYESVDDIQVVVPVGWAAGDTLTLRLNPSIGAYGDVTFARVPDMTISPMPITEGDLYDVAGYGGAKSTAAVTAPLVSGSFAALTPAQRPVVSVPGATKENVVLTFPTGDPNTGSLYQNAAGNAYLVTLSNVKLAVDGSAPLAQKGGAIFLTQGANTATLAYVAQFRLSAAAASAPRSFGGSVSLPSVTVSELVPDRFVAGTLPLKLTVTSNQSSGTVQFDTASPVTASDSAGSATPPTVSLSAPAVSVVAYGTSTNNPATPNSVTLSGITVIGVAAGATLTLTLSTLGHPAAVNTAPFAASPGLAKPSVAISTSADLPRIAGNNRYHTAQLASQQFGTALSKVIVANGESGKKGIDALAANYLAGVHGAPILLTAAKTLPTETVAGLIAATNGAAGAITVYVMGKTDSVSAAVRAAIVSTLNAAGHATVNIVEVAGGNRFATSAQAATLPGAAAVGTVQLTSVGPFLPTAFLASGLVNADALAAGAVAYANKLPILLAGAGTSLDASVSGAITTLGIKQVVILGGTDRVSAAVAASLTALGVSSVHRIAGSSRYGTAAQIAELNWFQFGKTGQKALIANGVTGWPDALSAGPLAGKKGYPLLTTAGTSLAPEAAAFLTAHKAALIDGVIGLGKSATVADSVLSSAMAALS